MYGVDDEGLLCLGGSRSVQSPNHVTGFPVAWLGEKLRRAKVKRDRSEPREVPARVIVQEFVAVAQGSNHAAVQR